MIAGVVTTKDVLLHSAAIVHDFGLRTWLSCCKAILTNRRTTFLELVWQPCGCRSVCGSSPGPADRAGDQGSGRFRFRRLRRMFLLAPPPQAPHPPRPPCPSPVEPAG